MVRVSKGSKMNPETKEYWKHRDQRPSTIRPKNTARYRSSSAGRDSSNTQSPLELVRNRPK